ncbi:MAG: LPS assembly protein LptD, partial [Pseudomonadota bacterium]
MRRLIAVLLVWLMPQMALAQSAASLVADSITIPPGGTQLIASGNVEVFFEDTRLSARRIIFDQTTDRLIMEGPIFIVAGDGTLFTADQADLDPRLENGILRGARLVLNEQLQLGANRIDRVDGRYTQLSQVAVTSCHVCAEGETPLWEIRAREIIHDEAARQLYFEGASFRVAGVPIFWLPQMRLPDPTLTRATGVLTPRIRSSDILGFGVKLPYFIRLGDHRDLTLTPYLSSSTTTLEALYRQAYLRGELRIEAAASQDDLTDRTRAYVFADGIFDLGDDVILRFDIEYASDDTYLLDYGYSDKDRLDSELSFERVRDRDLTRARLTYYSSLRDGEPSETLPPLLADVQWERRVSADWGGTYTFTSDMQAHYRDISDPVLGRDVARLGFGTGWQNSWTTDYGLVVEATTGFDLDYYTIGNDPTFDDTLRTTTYAATTLRYPMIRETASATHVIEPIVHLAWSNVSGDAVPNEDSNATEFDQT